jgi:hypothetical protein
MSNECPICLEVLKGTGVTVDCCKKHFHVSCYLKCMELKRECPMCRAKFEETVVEVEETVEEQVNKINPCKIISSVIFFTSFGIFIYHFHIFN